MMKSLPPIFPPRRDYASRSVKDLLDARSAYHVHLSLLPNVAATAIGRYLIHQDDWYATHPPTNPRPAHIPYDRKTTRTLANTVIRPWSWPCVLVFVKRMEGKGKLESESVPRTLYLPDGRVVPTCVVETPPDESLPPPITSIAHASSLLGGGYLCMRRNQGENAFGTISCLVRKNGNFYALTNRHVAGEEGEKVYAYVRGEPVEIGTTTSMGLNGEPISEVFPAWAMPRNVLAFDAGLIRIADVSRWTSQVFGIGEIDEPFDATECSVTLDLIGCPLRAFGGVSGVLEGEIRALFYRYASQGGFEFGTDLLIGPRVEAPHPTGRPMTHPGDSGSLWFYDPPRKRSSDDYDVNLDLREPEPNYGERARRLVPVGLQWGGQRVRANGRSSAFALASFFSSVCRLLDVRLERGWSIGHDEYWGKLAHFAIGWKACERVSGNLGKLMMLNQANIGFGDKDLKQGSAFRAGRDGFVPLADVPDYVWTQTRKSTEGVQHFADIDIYDINGGPSLLQQCVANPNNMAASAWKVYFDGFAAKGVGPDSGCLPLRVWQIWEAMCDYLREQDMIRFVAAAGALAHYVADASQPFHCSYLHHGVPPMMKVGGRKYPYPKDSAEMKAFKESSEAKIHSIYDEGIFEVEAEAMLQGLNNAPRRAGKLLSITSGHDAAVAVISMMDVVQKRLTPMDIIKADDPSLRPKERSTALWNKPKIRNAAMASLIDSLQLLTALWSSAWKTGGGNSVPENELQQFSQPKLEAIYRDSKFLPSMTLDKMASSGKFDPPAKAAGASSPSAPAKGKKKPASTRRRGGTPAKG